MVHLLATVGAHPYPQVAERLSDHGTFQARCLSRSPDQPSSATEWPAITHRSTT